MGIVKSPNSITVDDRLEVEESESIISGNVYRRRYKYSD